MGSRILIVEDQFVEANHLQIILTRAGYQVCALAYSVTQAWKAVNDTHPDFVLIDIFLKGRQTGIDLARMLQQRDIPFLFISANSNKSILDEAKTTHPYGFLVKPFREADVLVSLDIARYVHESKAQARKQIATGVPLPAQTAAGIIGDSAPFRDVLEQVGFVAQADTSVLIIGESGTGKEKLADFIHQASARNTRPMIKVNCSALPLHLVESELFGHEKGAFTGATERRIGKFELAEGGTIFLDEVCDLPFQLQSKLLRVLQEKEIERVGGRSTLTVDIRIIASTNRNLEREIAEGRFRIDLYYRLNVFPIAIPPLRERQQDILLLARHFLNYYAERMGKKAPPLSEAAENMLLAHRWPGNVRELENLIERCVVLGTGPTPQHLDASAATADATGTDHIGTLEEIERNHIIRALAKSKGRVSGEGGAAELLGIAASTLHARIKKFGIVRKG